MYWEDFWNLVQMAANFTADEKNAELKFQYMLHADKKSAQKWSDLPIPFPEEGEEIIKDKSGISQLPHHLKKSSVYKEE